MKVGGDFLLGHLWSDADFRLGCSILDLRHVEAVLLGQAAQFLHCIGWDVGYQCQQE